MTERLLRAQVPVEQTWNLEDLFPAQAKWEQEYDAIRRDLPNVTQYEGKVGENALALLSCLLANEAIELRWIRVSTYASLRFSEDGTNPVNQANASRVDALQSQIQAATSFIASEILNIKPATLDAFYQEQPELTVFRGYMDKLFETAPHRLSPETETALAALGETLSAPYSIYQRGKTSDMKFNPIVTNSDESKPVSFALYEDHYELSPNTSERRAAFASFGNTLDAYKNTFAATYAAEVKKHVALAKLRGYASAEHMLLHPQRVTMEMYENFLDVIRTELAPHMRKLAGLRQRVLGLSEMYHCDLKVPLDTDYSPKTSYEEASSVILDALSIMGPEYTEIMKTGLSSRWVDLSDNVGKSTGAFCSSPYGVHPYILITWTDTMRGAFVLAHELGHAGHFALAQKYQRLTNTRPSAFFIEAPSTMNELLLGHHILSKSTDPNVRRFVILQFLGTYYHNFVTHLLEGEYQRRVYRQAERGVALTADVLCETKGDVLSEFWGDAVVIDDTACLTWMRQPHYYMGLYPYTYSAGLTTSTAAALQIREEGTPAVERWLQALKSGGTLSPLALTKLAGVDMSTAEPIRAAVAYVGSLVDELEKSF